jgi:two-component system, OmpR family, sensor histidine kinase CpxA
MLMPRLFWKIFLWFWLAMVLVGCTLSFSISKTRPASEQKRLRSFARWLMPLQAQYMARLFEEHGVSALSNYLNEARPLGALAPILYRADGVDLNGNPAAADMRPWIIQAGLDSETEFEGDPADGQTLQGVTGPSGKRYVLYAKYGVPPGPFFLGEGPSTQIERLLAVILAGAVVCLMLAHYITAPVLRLQKASRQLANGNLRIRIGPEFGRRRDEIADLARGFDLMADRVEALVQSQHQLLQAISHETRSPLARLTLAVELAKRERGEERNELFQRIENEAHRIEVMLSQILTLARLDNGEPAFPRTLVELSLLVSDIVADADFEGSPRKKSVILADVEACTVAGSEYLLRSAIENVIRNAVRYTREFSCVEVTLTTDKNFSPPVAVIHVVDQGPGVPPSDLVQIFKPFYRVNNARERETGGTGLGLAITERVVRLYSGAVAARNANLGGLDVEIRLPTPSSPFNLILHSQESAASSI